MSLASKKWPDSEAGGEGGTWWVVLPATNDLRQESIRNGSRPSLKETGQPPGSRPVSSSRKFFTQSSTHRCHDFHAWPTAAPFRSQPPTIESTHRVSSSLGL